MKCDILFDVHLSDIAHRGRQIFARLAYDAPPMQWPAELPYSPIIGRERDAHGLDWYVHADGSKSITQMVFRRDLGRLDPVTNVFNPAKVLPMEPDPDKKPDKKK